MRLTCLSTLLFIQSLVAGQQLQSAPPKSSWISHLRVLGDGCSSATAQVAPDSSSFTITWKFDQLDPEVLATGSQAAAGSRKRDCGVAFILEMPPAESNRSAIFLDSERSGTWPQESGSKAMIHSSMAALSDLWPVSYPRVPLDQKGWGKGWSTSFTDFGPQSEPQSLELYGSDSFRVTHPIYAAGQANETEGSVELPGRDHPLHPISCASIANSNIGPSSGDYSMWGNSITMLESFELSGAEGEMSMPRIYEHKVSLFWLEPCLFWYNDRPSSVV